MKAAAQDLEAYKLAVQRCDWSMLIRIEEHYGLREFMPDVVIQKLEAIAAEQESKA